MAHEQHAAPSALGIQALEDLRLVERIEVARGLIQQQERRIVQESASLLGETAAETKIALSKLKESITNE